MTAPNSRERILPRLIEDEMQQSFINYSMSVIVSRALPDVRDGLKPVHRRILYAMNELGLIPNRAYKKSATVVGDVLGKYHPHGDSSVYEAMVRMVQDFSLRYPMVDGQGNFGSVDGDPAAAYRYTEARMTRIALEMLEDIDKNTVDFQPNFDDQREEPTVLPSKIPNLLINGSSGIAVGMATNMPPHNLREVAKALGELVKNPDCTVDDLLKHVKGPDFPTGGYIYGEAGIREAYETGRGRVIMRARVQIEENERTGRNALIITELPYQVNKANLTIAIADLASEKKIEGISGVRDESDREGMRLVVELKRDAIAQVVLNQLYKHTAMQSTFGVINLALVNGAPKVMALKEILGHFIEHRHQVIVRRTEFDLAEAKKREHILEGLKIAVDNIDEVIAIIRSSADTGEADRRLRDRFALSELQADAILNMRLAKLTGLEIDKLEAELAEVRATIAELQSILDSREKRMGILLAEVEEVATTYGDARRTEILRDQGEFSVEDLIAEEDMVITISHTGYIKRIPVSTYRKQRRGGRGLTGMETKELDWVETLFIASTHDYLMFFSDRGTVYWLKVHEIPQGGRAARGKPVVNCINIREGERIAALVPVRTFGDDEWLMFATRNGTVKKTVMSAYGNVRTVGINAINIEADDELIDVQKTRGNDDIVLATSSGMSIRFHESDVREMGRATGGVKGIELGVEDRVIGMVVVRERAELLVVSEKGIGKRSLIGDYRVQKRGGKGIITMQQTPKTGRLIALKDVLPEDELMMITKGGVIIRCPVEGIRVSGRNTQGVKLMNLDTDDRIVDVARVQKEDDDAEGAEGLDGGEDAAADGTEA
ncbi:MAG TPA: DNA gyrase subunit A [Gemmatimonadales bacterium]|jgi:DNA gyrase subunit A|nr:DNA gyrase subunit A [Gemmatimonadales bacterium]